MGGSSEGSGGIGALENERSARHEVDVGRNGHLVSVHAEEVGPKGVHGDQDQILAGSVPVPLHLIAASGTGARCNGDDDEGNPLQAEWPMTNILRQRGLLLSVRHCITDNGAGGLSSSVGEMAIKSGGCELYLEKAPLKYTGLESWEILLSEAQERMTLAVNPEKIDRRSLESQYVMRIKTSGRTLTGSVQC